MIPVDGLCYKMGQSIYQFYKKFFHLSQNVYHATEKKQRAVRDKKVAKTGIASAATPSYNICMVSYVCLMTRLIQNLNE